jgi:NRPS condensation-like uncharacterized protein
LGCAFVSDPRETGRRGRPFWRRADLDLSSAFELVETDRPEEALWAFVADSLDYAAGPQVQARLFRGERDVVCIKIDHLAADVGGMKQYAYLLADIYSRLGADADFRPAPNLHSRRDQRQIYGPLGPRAWLRGLRPAWGAPPWPNPYESAACGDLRYAVRRLPSECLPALQSYGRARGATVNDVLLAAFFRALRTALHPTAETLGLTVPMDLRRYLPGGEAGAVCNLTGVLFPVLARGRDDELYDETLARVVEAMAPLKRDRPGIDGLLLFDLAFSLLSFRRLQKATAGAVRFGGGLVPNLSNFGVLDPRRLAFGEVEIEDAFMASPVFYPPSVMVGASTVRERLTRTFGYCAAALAPEWAEGLLDGFVDQLPMGVLGEN